MRYELISILTVVGGKVMDELKRTYKQLTNVDIDQESMIWDERGKGHYGEYLLFSYLYRYISGNYKILMNLKLPTNNYNSTEIDLLLIHETGIYVFEIKHYKGTIYGKDSDRNWTQFFKTTKNYVFKNPIEQNGYHIRALKKLFPNIPMRSFVVFTNSECKVSVVNNNHEIDVCTLRDVIEIFERRNHNATPILSIDTIDEIFKKLSKYSPMQESVCINSTEAPFYSWLQPIIDKLERIKHGVEKEKEILEIEIKKVKKAKFVNICISIVVVFACIFGSVCLSFATINHYREQMNAELEKNNAELLDFKQKFMHIDEINDGYNDLLSSYINVSNSTLLRYSDDSISFTANLTWLSEEYNVVIQEDAKYIVMTNDDKVFEYDVFDKNYNRTANTLGKNFEMSGALSKYIFNEVSDVNSVTYIKLVGVKLTKSDISQALIKENLEIELYNK